MKNHSALEEVKNQLERGIHEVMTSAAFHDWLKFIASFHSYSFNNTILIFFQKTGSYGGQGLS
ncbi:hypothetical protein M1K46_19295 [Fictibacillus sp. WQ 8-8]|uniref:hypothetical protein n=1 Tax=Fictibacillus sp. WQ 8-8 TaxID=2938788 RepID=UPI00210A6776|nr:hypothetical protein [Fictibacillus sp. WQ 8-8]MCQ6267777.1 hypothetical protein [Fictibacillus sp. WQ 8-8]